MRLGMQHQRGVALIVCVGLLAAMSAVAVLCLRLAVLQRDTAVNAQIRSHARMAAMAGLWYGVRWFEANGGNESLSGSTVHWRYAGWSGTDRANWEAPPWEPFADRHPDEWRVNDTYYDTAQSLESYDKNFVATSLSGLPATYTTQFKTRLFKYRLNAGCSGDDYTDFHGFTWLHSISPSCVVGIGEVYRNGILIDRYEKWAPISRQHFHNAGDALVYRTDKKWTILFWRWVQGE